MTDGGPDPEEETQPFTAPAPPPYGPPVPPGPAYGAPPPPPPPPPYAQVQPDYAPGWTPTYGVPLPGSLDHASATTALVLGIIAVTGLVLTPFCCITLPAVLCGPFAWYVGSRAVRDMDDAPGVYGNRGSARGGQVMGIVTTILGGLAVLGVVTIVVLVGVNDYSLV